MHTTGTPYLKTVDSTQANIRQFKNLKGKLYNYNANICCVFIRLFVSIIYKTKVRPSVGQGQQAISFSRTKVMSVVRATSMSSGKEQSTRR
jgi:hypothetical protein